MTFLSQPYQKLDRIRTQPHADSFRCIVEYRGIGRVRRSR
jgi:hypothetical protein